MPEVKSSNEIKKELKRREQMENIDIEIRMERLLFEKKCAYQNLCPECGGDLKERSGFFRMSLIGRAIKQCIKCGWQWEYRG